MPSNNKIVEKTMLRNGIICYQTSVQHTNGEYVDIYLERLRNGNTQISDGGRAYFYLYECLIDISELQNSMQNYIKEYAISLGGSYEEDWSLRKTLAQETPRNELEKHCITLAEASVKIVEFVFEKITL